MGKSDPYLQFSRQMPDGKLQAVHRTEVEMRCTVLSVSIASLVMRTLHYITLH